MTAQAPPPPKCSDALANFLDDRWAPHRYGQRPSYYFNEPDFDDPTHDRIKAAYDQIVDGARQLIELPVGKPVEMCSGLWWEPPTRFMGIAAGIQWEYQDKED